MNDHLEKELENIRRKQAETDNMKNLMKMMSGKLDQCEDKVTIIEDKFEADHKLSDTLKKLRHHATWIQQLLGD